MELHTGNQWQSSNLPVLAKALRRDQDKIVMRSYLLGQGSSAHQGVVDLDGPGDLKATLPLEQPVCGAPVISQLMGGSRGEEAHPDDMIFFG